MLRERVLGKWSLDLWETKRGGFRLLFSRKNQRLLVVWWLILCVEHPEGKEDRRAQMLALTFGGAYVCALF